MEHQFDLKGKDAEPWKDICCEACWNAEYERCTCRCGGKYHGIGNPNSKRNQALGGMKKLLNNGGVTVEEAIIIDESKLAAEMQRKEMTLADYEAITPTDCRWCEDKGKGTLGPLECYGHSGGWPVKGFEKLQWLYRTCSRCGYQWAIWKLGVPRA